MKSFVISKRDAGTRVDRFIEKTFGVKGRIALHKSSVQKGHKKPWEFVLQASYESEYGAKCKREDWLKCLELFEYF